MEKLQVLSLLGSRGQDKDNLSPVIKKQPSRLSNNADQTSDDDLGSLGNFMMAR